MKTETQLFSNEPFGSVHLFIYKLTPEDLPVPYSCSGKPGEKIPQPESGYKEKLDKLTTQVNADLGEIGEDLALQRLSDAVNEPRKIERDEGGRYTGMKCAEGTESRLAYLRDRVDVLVLQVLLKKLSEKYPKVKYLDPGRPDGYWGTHTRDSLRTFQAAAGIKVDGDFGPETLGALKEVFDGKKELDFSKKRRVEKEEIVPEPELVAPTGEAVDALEYEVEEVVKPAYTYELSGRKLTAKFVTDESPVVYNIVAPMDFTFDIGRDPFGRECIIARDGAGNDGWFELNVHTPHKPSLDQGIIEGHQDKTIWSRYQAYIPLHQPGTIEINFRR